MLIFSYRDREMVMWMFCCLALIVMLVLALWPDPDRVRTSYGIPDHQAPDLEGSTGGNCTCRHRARCLRSDGNLRGVSYSATPARAVEPDLVIQIGLEP